MRDFVPSVGDDKGEGRVNDDALAGDLTLEPHDAEHVAGGYKVSCHACSHVHNQTDPKCNNFCAVHGSSGPSGPGNIRDAY